MQCHRISFLLLAFLLSCMAAFAGKSDSLSHQLGNLSHEWSDKDSLSGWYNYLKSEFQRLGPEPESRQQSSILTHAFKQNSWREPITVHEWTTLRSLLIWIAYYHDSRTGEYSKALKYYTEAASVNNSARLDNSMHWYIHNPLGNIYTRLGDYKNALVHFEICKEALIQNNRPDLVLRLDGNLAICHYALGNTHKAISMAKSVLNNDKVNLKAQVNLNQALASWYLDMNKSDLAEPYIQKASQLMPGLTKQSSPGYHLPRLAEQYKLKARLAMAHQRIDKAQAYLQQSEELLIQIHGQNRRREFGKLYLDHADALLDYNYISEAMPYINKALQSVIPDYNPESGICPSDTLLYAENTIIEALQSKARAFEKLADMSSHESDHLINSLLCLESAVRCNRILRNSYIYDESRFIMLAENSDLISDAFRVIDMLQRTKSDIELNNTIRYLLIQSKAQVLESRRVANRRLRKLNSELRRAYSEILFRIDSLSRYTSNPSDSLQLSSLLSQKAAFQNKYLALDSIPDSSEIDCYIEYFAGKDHLWAYRKNGTSGKLIQLENSSTPERLVNQLTHLIRSRGPIDSINLLSRQAYNILLAPLEPLNTKLVIIPDGFLNTLSFACLINQKGHYLVKDHALIYNYKPFDAGNPFHTNKAIVINPLYAESMETKPLAYTRAGLADIPASREESAYLASLLNAELIQKNNILKSEFINTLDDTDILHYSGHAVQDGNMSYLALSSSDRSASRLYIQELDTLNLDLDMLFLAACNTKTGRLIKGEGSISLASQFYAAGVQSIASTLWAVNDATTASITKDFYNHLRKGARKSQALRKSQLDYLDNADPDYRHPYYWAGLVITGNDRPIDKGHGFISYLMLLGLALLAVLVFIYVKK